MKKLSVDQGVKKPWILLYACINPTLCLVPYHRLFLLFACLFCL